MANAIELRESMARIAANARAKLEEVQDNTTDERSAEIEREFDAMMADHDQLDQRAARIEKVDAADARANEVDVSKRPQFENRSSLAVDNGVSIDYRTAFAQMISVGGVGYMTQEARSVLETEHRIQTAGTGNQGGFTVPVELAGYIEKAMLATGPMYDSNIFTTINTTAGNTFNIPTIDDTAKVAVAHTEGTQPTDDAGVDAVFAQKTLSAFAFDTEWLRWSAELNADSVLNMESLLGELLGERMGRTANTALTTGTGSSAVEGIVTGSSLGVTAAAVAAVTGDEILDLIHSVDPSYRASPNTAIMMNDTTLKAVRKLKDGDGNYLWQMGNFQAGVPNSLLGYNVVINQGMDDMAATKKVMLFGDMKKYYVRKVGAPSLYIARERFAPDFGILGYVRLDGCVVNSAAIKHLKNAAS